MAEEGQQQQTQQTPPAGSGNGPAQQSPPPRPVPRRRSTDVAPVQMDPTPFVEAMRMMLEEVFGKEKEQQQGNTGEGQQQQQQQGNTGEQTPKRRRGSWFWGGPK